MATGQAVATHSRQARLFPFGAARTGTDTTRWRIKASPLAE
ncbi:MAG TPA: hypothetical protein VN642_14945 [Dongiaceae bacterium]|nr:hypothetical protein [Dongiaceae bacterium]